MNLASPILGIAYPIECRSRVYSSLSFGSADAICALLRESVLHSKTYTGPRGLRVREEKRERDFVFRGL